MRKMLPIFKDKINKVVKTRKSKNINGNASLGWEATLINSSFQLGTTLYKKKLLYCSKL